MSVSGLAMRRAAVRVMTLAAMLLTMTGAASAAPPVGPSAVPNVRGLWPTFVTFPGKPAVMFPMGIYQDGTALQIDVTGYATDDHRLIGTGVLSGTNIGVQMDDNFLASGLGLVYVGTVVDEKVMYGLTSRNGVVGFWWAFKSPGNF